MNPTNEEVSQDYKEMWDGEFAQMYWEAHSISGLNKEEIENGKH